MSHCAEGNNFTNWNNYIIPNKQIHFNIKLVQVKSLIYQNTFKLVMQMWNIFKIF